MMPGDPGAILGPRAHEICKQANFISEKEGCSEWMQPFMNQMALTLGSSSAQLNLFLDFGSTGIHACMPPNKPAYDQACVNESLIESVKQADIFLFFPNWYCGPSCAIEVEVAQQVKNSGHNLQLLELDWDDYYELFNDFSTPPNPSDTPTFTFDQDIEQYRAGSKAGVYILTAIQAAQPASSKFIPDGECAVVKQGCASGRTYRPGSGLTCALQSFGGVVGATACDVCRSAVASLFATASEGGLGACAIGALDASPVCGVSNVEDGELGFPVCEALVVGACAALEDELKEDDHLTLGKAQLAVCDHKLEVCPAEAFTNRFCGCYSAGQCAGLDHEVYCCSKKSEWLDIDEPCLRDFHQTDITPEICV